MNLNLHVTYKKESKSYLPSLLLKISKFTYSQEFFLKISLLLSIDFHNIYHIYLAIYNYDTYKYNISCMSIIGIDFHA